jgi:CRISPR-associated protein Csx14
MLLLSAALLYFDQSDRIWHLYSTEEVRHQTHEGAVLHLPGHPGVRLVCIRVPPWGHFFPALRPTTEPARPDTVLGLQTSLRDAEERARCQQVCDRLTPRQREVLRAFAAGGTLQDVSRELSITVATVHTHKTHIFQECCAVWNLPPGTRLDYRWLRDTFAAYFAG